MAMGSDAPFPPSVEIDTTVPVSARIWNYWLGGTDYIDADLYDPDALLRSAKGKLDFRRPVAIMLMGILGHIGDPDENDDRVAQSIVDTLKAALPSGGFLAIYDSSNVDLGLND